MKLTGFRLFAVELATGSTRLIRHIAIFNGQRPARLALQTQAVFQPKAWSIGGREIHLTSSWRPGLFACLIRHHRWQNPFRIFSDLSNRPHGSPSYSDGQPSTLECVLKQWWTLREVLKATRRCSDNLNEVMTSRLKCSKLDKIAIFWEFVYWLNYFFSCCPIASLPWRLFNVLRLD